MTLKLIESNSLGFVAGHLLLLGHKLLLKLLLSELDQCILKNVFGHGRTVELVTLMRAVNLLQRVDLQPQFVHLLFNFRFFLAGLFLEELCDLLGVVLIRRLKNPQCAISRLHSLVFGQ